MWKYFMVLMFTVLLTAGCGTQPEEKAGDDTTYYEPITYGGTLALNEEARFLLEKTAGSNVQQKKNSVTPNLKRPTEGMIMRLTTKNQW